MAEHEDARAAAFASQADRSRELAAKYVAQMVGLAAQVKDLRDGVAQAIATMHIPHRWNGTTLELLVNDIWVAGPDLKGKDARGVDSIAVVGGRLIVTYDDGEFADVGAVGGDVVGPSSSVDASIVVFDGETGRLIKDSGKSLSDFATAAQGTKADTAVQPEDLTKAAVGLDNVDNTSDADKPVSSAQQTALNGKADTDHTHSIDDVEGLSDALSGKADTTSLAAVATSGLYSDLLEAPQGAVVLRDARTSNAKLLKTDIGKLIDITSGSFTQTFDPAATLESGWWCYLRNSGTGIITLDPDGSEVIDGRATIRMYPGESLLVQCNGANFKTVGRRYGWILVSSVTVSTPVGQVDAEAGFDDTEFSSMRVHLLKVKSGGSSFLYARLKKGGSYLTSQYQGHLGQLSSSFSGTSFPNDKIVAGANGGGGGWVGSIELENHRDPSRQRIIGSVQEGVELGFVYGVNTVAGEIQGMRVYCSSGYVQSGKIDLYGYR